MSSKLASTVVAVCVTLAAAWATTPVSAEDKGGGAAIKVGALFARTGGAANLGEPEARTAEMLVARLNAAGGVAGRKIELIVKDTNSTPATAVSLAKQLIDEQSVLAIIGPSTSGETLAIKGICQEGKTILISCAAARPSVRWLAMARTRDEWSRRDAMDTLDDVLLDVMEKMDNTVKVLRDQFSGLRTGKASPALVDGVQVMYYGVPTRLRDIANISTPEPRLIVISPYDPTALPEIEKAILAANLGVTPRNDGRVIRVPIPELNEERRKEIVKVAKRQSEEARIAVRNVRREGNDSVKALQKDGKITEDERDRGLDEVQKATDAHIAKIDHELKNKEAEVMAV